MMNSTDVDVAEVISDRPSQLKLLLTMAEAAHALGLCRAVMYELVASGQVQSIKIGRARRVPIAVLEAFIARRLEEQKCA